MIRVVACFWWLTLYALFLTKSVIILFWWKPYFIHYKRNGIHASFKQIDNYTVILSTYKDYLSFNPFFIRTFVYSRLCIHLLMERSKRHGRDIQPSRRYIPFQGIRKWVYSMACLQILLDTLVSFLLGSYQIKKIFTYTRHTNKERDKKKVITTYLLAFLSIQLFIFYHAL